jgi:hypothetical protein
MIMMGDKKKALTAILGEESENVGVRESGSPSDLEQCASELIQAVESKDASSVASALRACWAACEAECYPVED